MHPEPIVDELDFRIGSMNGSTFCPERKMEAILKTSVEKIEAMLEMLELKPSEWRKQDALQAVVGHTVFSKGAKMLLIALGHNEDMESIKGKHVVSVCH